jgi:hypothetical protein
LPWHISGSTVIRESKALLDIEEFYTAGPGLQADHTTFDRTFLRARNGNQRRPYYIQHALRVPAID